MYKIVTDELVVDQVAALPDEALAAYADALGVIALVPWNGRPYNDDKPDGNMRQLLFGARYQGTVTYLILDDQREVHPLLVQWASYCS